MNKTIHIYNPVHFEKWDYRNSADEGIGGSETMATEMAWRLARRGYKVKVYSPVRADTQREWRRTEWYDLSAADFSEPGLWLLLRNVECVDQMSLVDQEIWLVCQDEAPIGINPERASKCDRILALCEWHKRFLERNWPETKGRVCVSANGLKAVLISDVLSESPERNPNRIMYASSPDRGLLQLCRIFKRAREFVPELELHCFYGFENIEAIVKVRPDLARYRNFVDAMKKEMDQPGIFWHGRVSQRQLYVEWMKSGMWVYPTHFHETSCITSMEAQALGAVPVFTPLAALGENVMCGFVIDGDAEKDALIQARFAAEIVRLAWNPHIQDEIRPKMMQMARYRFNWERVVDQYEAMMHGWLEGSHSCQFAFQRKHASGKVLNIGCADDPAKLGERPGAVNIDIAERVHSIDRPTAAHLIYDARQPLPLDAKFDTVVLGDILEHLTDDDAIKVLNNARDVLADGGKIVITCPEDYRPRELQHKRQDLMYADGESAYHDRAITQQILNGWLAATGLTPTLVQHIDYGNFTGRGLVVEPVMEAVPC